MSRFIVLLVALTPGVAVAEIELSAYGGIQSSPHSQVTIRDTPGFSDDRFRAGWEGRSFEVPLYYGLRATYWQNDSFGFGVDFSHAKVYADDETLDETGLEVLELTDGINILTFNAYRRLDPLASGLQPYFGGGLGVAIPHVEVTTAGGSSETSGFQVTGPAVTWIAGARYPVTDRWGLFGEYKGTYSMNSATLDGGGTLETNIVTNALNLGLSFSF